jgi:K+-sensing histidine kinase KdpD
MKFITMNRPFKILLIEDTAFDADLAKRELQKAKMPFVMEVVSSKDAFMEQLEQFRPDVILSDHALPSFSSLEALALVKEKGLDLPFILVTGSVSEVFAMECIREGVSDYILKQSLTRLPSAIINAYEKKKAEMERSINLKKLEEANQELKTFIYRASHDIRGPICSLKGLINVSRDESKTGNVQELINYMDKGVNKLDDIIMHLIGTLELKDKVISKEPINLEELINDLLKGYKKFEPFKKVKVTVSNKSKQNFVSDRNLLTVILNNILENAFQYHNYGIEDPFVKIEISDMPEGVLFSITDNGLGIRSELQHKVFEMFFRGNERAMGAGLGLYLTKIAVTKLEGRIELNSIENQGTSVHVVIPSIKEK